MKVKVCSVCSNHHKPIYRAKTRDHDILCYECWMKLKLSTEAKTGTDIEAKRVSIDELHATKKKIDKLRKDEEKSIPELIKLATIVFNKWIRKRDSHDGRFFCICCNDLFPTSTMDAAHYMNAGNHSATRFDENNVNGCCQICNRYLDGNLERYRVNLINKIGQKEVELIEAIAKVSVKWDRESLLEIIERYK